MLVDIRATGHVSVRPETSSTVWFIRTTTVSSLSALSSKRSDFSTIFLMITIAAGHASRPLDIRTTNHAHLSSSRLSPRRRETRLSFIVWLCRRHLCSYNAASRASGGLKLHDNRVASAGQPSCAPRISPCDYLPIVM